MIAINFDRVLIVADQDGQPRTTYSLRHHALQKSLYKSGGKVNIYNLVRNAGT